MSLFFLLLGFCALVSSFIWWKYLPYSKFVNYVWVDWNLLLTILFGSKKDGNHYIFQKMRRLCRKHEKEEMFILWTTEPNLLVFGENAVKFFSNEPSMTDKPEYYKLFKYFGETALFVSSGITFKKLKKLMMPAFYPNVIKNDVPIIKHYAECLVEMLDGTKGLATHQLEDFLKINNLRAFLDSTMGIKSDIGENKIKTERLAEIFLKLHDIACYRLYTPWLTKDFMMKFSNIGKEYLKLKEELDGIIDKIIEDIKENVISQTKHTSHEKDAIDIELKQKSFGEIIIKQHLKDPSFDMNQIRSQVTGVLLGGYDTVANTLMWCFWLLGNHQDIQQKAFEEVMSTINGELNYADLRKLTYLECILKESLRLYPPAPLYGRTSCKDIHYRNHIVPKGTPIGICIFPMQRDAKLYPNPDDFIPERFSDDGSNIKPWTNIPFAEGVRSCIGKHFAMLEMKIFLIYVLRKFRIVSLDQPEDINISYEIILRSSKPLRMQFIPR